MIIMKRGKRLMTQGMKLQNQEKIRTLWRKGKQQILGDTGSRHHQTSGNERKKRKVFQGNEKATPNKTMWQESYKRDN